MQCTFEHQIEPAFNPSVIYNFIIYPQITYQQMWHGGTYCCIRSKKKEKKLVAQIHNLHSDVTVLATIVHKCRDAITCYWGCLVGVPDLPSSICSLCLRWNTSIWQTANAMIISHVGIFVQLHNKNNFDRIQFLDEWVKYVSNGVPGAGTRATVLPPKPCEWNAAPATRRPTKYKPQQDHQTL